MRTTRQPGPFSVRTIAWAKVLPGLVLCTIGPSYTWYDDPCVELELSLPDDIVGETSGYHAECSTWEDFFQRYSIKEQIGNSLVLRVSGEDFAKAVERLGGSFKMNEIV